VLCVSGMDEFFANDFSFPDSAVIVGRDFVEVRDCRVAVAEVECLRLKAELLRPLLLAEVQRRACHARVRCGSNANGR
jgi:hypothetical protein